MIVKSATEDEASLWCCERCSESGVLLLPPHVDVYSVVEALDNAHRLQSPKCEATVGRVRVLRPDNWLRTSILLKDEA